MNSISLLYLRFRSCYVPVSLLLVLLQRAPIVRTIISINPIFNGSPTALLRSVFVGATALGTINTLAGATTLSPAPGSFNNPAKTMIGQSFTGGFAVIGAPNAAGSYEVKGSIPAGLTIAGLSGDTVNSSVVSISGTPTQSGSFTLNIRAWHKANKGGDGGKNTYKYVINVDPAPTVAPTISAQPQSVTALTGETISLSVTATGDPSPAFQWQKNGNDIPGATSSTLSLPSASPSMTGNYAVIVTNLAGNLTSSTASITVTDPIPPLTVTDQPSSKHVPSGSDITLRVAANADSPVTVQWYRHRSGDSAPQPLNGETQLVLSLPHVESADMGFYFARISDGTTEVQSGATTLTVSGGTSRLINLSTRGRILDGGTLTPGFVMKGDGSKPLLMRSVGPQLRAFGVTAAMDDPVMDVIPLQGSAAILHNDNWGDGTSTNEIITVAQTVGAFPLDAGSLDAALLGNVSLPNSMGNRGYTVRIGSTSTNTGGIAIAEIYDPEIADSGKSLINVSARGYSGVGADALVPGFVIGGNGAKRMLIRVVGPTLADFGVTETMPNPKLSVIPLGQDFAIATNDNWGGEAELLSAFSTAGAFAFSNASTLDAAVVLDLPPGGYTVRVESSDGVYGNVLVEAYDLDQ